MTPYVVATMTGRRARANNKLARTQAITATNAVDEHIAIDVNGSEQWLRIRGHNVGNPVLLYLHGGPGGPTLPLYRHCMTPWEEHFTVVQWDQRGAGKSFLAGTAPGVMTLPQLVDDTLSIISYLRERFAQRTIALLGHSWGSCLGVHVLHAAPPGVIGAYVGVGQVVDMIGAERLGYEHALFHARRTEHEVAIEQLEAIAPYPGLDRRDHRKRDVARFWARYFNWVGADTRQVHRNRPRLMSTPDYSVRDIYHYLQGTLLSQRTLGTKLMTEPDVQPAALSTDFAVPFYLYCGRADAYTPTPLVETYFEDVSAPVKRLRMFEQSDHWPMEDEAEAFLAALLEDVRPQVVAHDSADATSPEAH